MKELKFRAFHKSTKIMFNVVQIDFMNKFVFSYERIRSMSKYPYFDTVSYLSSECELMQSTGLKDSTQFQKLTKEEQENWLKSNKQEDWRGKEIFEGDIIVIPNIYPFYHENKLNYVGVVEFIYSQWEYVLKCVNPKKRGISNGINNILNDAGYEENTLTHYKILGNIHQNPELLKINK